MPWAKSGSSNKLTDDVIWSISSSKYCSSVRPVRQLPLSDVGRPVCGAKVAAVGGAGAGAGTDDGDDCLFPPLLLMFGLVATAGAVLGILKAASNLYWPFKNRWSSAWAAAVSVAHRSSSTVDIVAAKVLVLLLVPVVVVVVLLLSVGFSGPWPSPPSTLLLSLSLARTSLASMHSTKQLHKITTNANVDLLDDDDDHSSFLYATLLVMVMKMM